MSIAFYSDDPISDDTLDGIRRVLREIGIGSAQLDAMGEGEAEDYQREVDDTINSILSSYYQVPLWKIQRNGLYLKDGTPQEHWPGPIGFIAMRIAAAEITLSVFKEVDTVIQEKAQNMRQRAMGELYALVSGNIGPSRRLDGQYYKARNRFIPPTVAPLEHFEGPQGATP